MQIGIKEASWHQVRSFYLSILPKLSGSSIPKMSGRDIPSPPLGIEPGIFCLQSRYSAPELWPPLSKWGRCLLVSLGLLVGEGSHSSSLLGLCHSSPWSWKPGDVAERLNNYMAGPNSSGEVLPDIVLGMCHLLTCCLTGWSGCLSPHGRIVRTLHMRSGFKKRSLV